MDTHAIIFQRDPTSGKIDDFSGTKLGLILKKKQNSSLWMQIVPLRVALFEIGYKYSSELVGDKYSSELVIFCGDVSICLAYK